MRKSLLLSFLLACSPDLPKQSNVVKLRVLAVRADPPALVTGETMAVSLTALAIDPSGAPIQMRWSLCPLPANEPPPATLDCPGSYGIDLPDARLDLTDPRTAPLWPVLYSTPDGTPLTDAQQSALLAQGTTVAVGFSAQAGGEVLKGFAQIPLRQTPGPDNPEMLSLQADGVDFPALLQAGKKVHLMPSADGSGALNFSFFATAGDIESLRSANQTVTGEPEDPSIDYTAPATPGPVQFWVVVRDGQGGVGWLSRSANVQ